MNGNFLDSGSVSGPRGLPPDLLREASRRLELLGRVVGAGFGCILVFNNLLRSGGFYELPHSGVQDLLCLAVMAVSGTLLWLSRSGRFSPLQLLDLGLAYEIVVGFAISMGDNLTPLTADRPLTAISWLCVWIVMFPLVVPASRAKTLLAGCLTASTWPLAFSIGLALGHPSPPGSIVALNFLESYVAAGLALAPALILRRLGTAVARAREMGSYELVERLGQGGMGEVWLARHRLLARPAAVKLIRPAALGLETSGNDSLVRRFEREARATAALRSPHTVELYDFGVTRDGTFYYVMESLDGLDLDSVVRRFGCLDAERAVYLLLQACDSLAEAHQMGLVHRDIKPANIFVCRKGIQHDFVKVLDFGLVKSAWQQHEGTPLTVEGAVKGTPAFMAPEVALGSSGVDARADVYGLGCVAYWLLTARRVFDGATPLELALQHVQTQPVPPSKRTEIPLPPGLERIILDCLEKDPARRPATAEVLGSLLADCALASPWSPERARRWWEAHMPGLGDSTAGARVGS